MSFFRAGKGGGEAEKKVIFFQATTKAAYNSSNTFAVGMAFSDYYWAIGTLMYHVNNGVVQYSNNHGQTWTTDSSISASISGTSITISGNFSTSASQIALVAFE